MTKFQHRQFKLDEHPSGSWLYAYGLLANRELKFFSDANWQQLFQTSSKEAFLSQLRDKNYSGDTLEDALNQSELDDLEFIYSSIPDLTYLNPIFLEKDGHNLKTLLRVQLSTKENISLKRVENLLLSPYSISPKNILTQIRKSINKEEDKQESFLKPDDEPLGLLQKNHDSVPIWMKKAIDLSIKDFSNHYSVARVDQIVEKAINKAVFKEYKSLDSEWFTELYQMQIDFKNLELLFRSRTLNIDKDYFEHSLLDYGKIDISDWIKYFELSNEELATQLSEINLEKFAHFAHEYEQLGEASVFTKNVDTVLITKLQEAKSFSPGPEKVISYLFVRNLERKNIRIARACVTNNFSQEHISQLIRPGY